MSHTVELLSVGTELLLGNIANTDAQMLSQGLSALGLNVYYHTVVGDNPQRAREAVAIAKKRADIIITTGGLGPTCDDLTKNVLADAFGKKLVFHEASAERIRSFFDRIGRTMTDNNLQQAMLPEGCTVLDNDWGTAPGCAFEAEGVHVIMLPGPPSECRPMFYERAVPYLARFSEGVIASHTLKLFGIGESSMEAQLREQMNVMSNPTLAPYAKEGECELRVTAKAATMEQAQALLLPAVEQLKGHFGPLVYGVDGRRSAAGLPALNLDNTLCSEAAMAIQHYLSTGASPVGCTVVALDPALTDGEMVELFLTLCGDETILSEAYTRYGVALTSDSGVYYAAGFFA